MFVGVETAARRSWLWRPYRSFGGKSAVATYTASA